MWIERFDISHPEFADTYDREHTVDVAGDYSAEVRRGRVLDDSSGLLTQIAEPIEQSQGFAPDVYQPTHDPLA